MFLTKLTRSHFRVHRIRAALTICAIAMAVSLVVSVTSGFESLRATAHKFLNTFMGSVDAQITHQSDTPGGVPESLVKDLRQDSAVKQVSGRIEEDCGLINKSGHPLVGRAAQLIGIDRVSDTSSDSLACISGQWFQGDRGNYAVVDQVAAERLGVQVGDTFAIGSIDRKFDLKVVGIVKKPKFIASFVQSVYVPLRTAQSYMRLDNPPSVSRLVIELKPKSDETEFAGRWKPRLAAIDPRLKFRLQRETRDEMDNNLQSLEVLSYLGGTVSMLAATFIVFSAQSMGVAERQRTLALMRAIGAFRSQVGLLVIAEGLALALAGMIVGIPLGLLWVKLLALQFDKLFAAGIVANWWGVAFAVTGITLAALLASLLPAISAMRVSPLEAMVPLAKMPSAKMPFIVAGIGLMLVAIDSILLFMPHGIIPRDLQFYGHFVLGLPGIMIGFFLLAPLFVKAVEQFIGPIVAAMFGLKFAMLRQQISSGIWRAAGTCAALMVGLAILVVMQTNGHSLLQGWRLPTKFPDIFIFSVAVALDDADLAKLSHIKGIKTGEVLGIAVTVPGLGSGFFAIRGFAAMPDATMFFGVDPDKAFKMMELDFREGSSEEATVLLKKGRHILVTQEFRELKQLHKGDKITLETVLNGKQEYTIAGVVWSPGMDLILGMYDLGKSFDQRTVGSIFGSMEDAKRDFDVHGVRFVAANLDYFVNKDELMSNLQRELGIIGMTAGDVRQIKAEITSSFEKLLLMVSSVAFAAMAVSSLGVTNTIMASVRSRQWQFGVLRSIGFTRSQLLRLVLAEALLLGIVGIGLGLAAGFTMTINAKKLAAIVMGNNPPIVIPWHMIGIGVASIVGISLIASIWPAVHVARAEPLQLLQAGRASQ